MSSIKKTEQELPEASKSVQGSLWCTACNGKGKVPYRDRMIMCPICKGSGLCTFKGKTNKI